MTVRELAKAFDTIYPRELSAEWDNDGLLVSPDPDREPHNILTVLDVTDEVLDVAEENGFDTVIAHHPLIFRPIGEAVAGKGVGGRVARALRAGISILCFHTRADAARSGVNELLALLLGLAEVRAFEDGLPRIGTLPEAMPSADFIERVKRATGAPFVRVGGRDRTVRTVALCGGAGKDYAHAAASEGADLYLSGELGYHTLLDADDLGCMMLEIGHDASEMQITGALAAAARRFCPGAKVTELPHLSVRTF